MNHVTTYDCILIGERRLYQIITRKQVSYTLLLFVFRGQIR